MLIVGDISGIQAYLFDVAHHHGGQSVRLRARSFTLQMMSDVALVRVMRAANISAEKLLLSAAGKFVLIADAISDAQRSEIDKEVYLIGQWLRDNTGADVRFSLAYHSGEGPLRDQYSELLGSLQSAKCRPLAAIAQKEGRWVPSALVLELVAPPCVICRTRRGTEKLEAGGLACSQCVQQERVGRALVDARYVSIGKPDGRPTAHGDALCDVAGCAVGLHSVPPLASDNTIAVLDLSLNGPAIKSPLSLRRRLARHVPRLDFDEIARRSTGAPYLGVLKMDVDSLGQQIDRILATARDWARLQEFSRDMDVFFTERLERELCKAEWQPIYTVFSGGDDLLVVGPWNTVFDYANHVHNLFMSVFAGTRLTISGGMALAQPRHPIKRLAEQAEELLDTAKRETTIGASGPKDQFAAFGQIWKWDDHEAIAARGKQLARWVQNGAAERGWLDTLLGLSQQRGKSPLAAARLDYQVTRNYPQANSPDPSSHKLRAWIDGVVTDFEDCKQLESRYLPTIVRYAVLATRAAEGD